MTESKRIIESNQDSECCLGSSHDSKRCQSKAINSDGQRSSGKDTTDKEATVQSVLDALQQVAPLELAEPWDSVGLQVGDPQTPVSRVLICLDANSRTVARAAREKYQLLLTHHPLIFSPLTAVRSDMPVQKHVYQLIQNRLTLIAAHTNLDAADGGVADSFTNAVCQALLPLLKKADPARANDMTKQPESVFINKLENSGPFVRRLALSRSLELRDVYRAVHHYLQAAGSRLNTDTNKPVKQIAIWPGSLSDEIRPQLMTTHTDLIICGECKYHLAMELADSGLIVMDIGHDISERTALEPLQQKMKQLLPQLVFDVDYGFDYNKVAY